MRCRRGSIATTFAFLAVVICGMVALGTEVGTWYVIKRNAQNAADAAALAGALALAQIDANVSDDAVGSATSLAGRNGFCMGCTANRSPQTVTVTVGSFSGRSFSATSGTGNPAVQVVITQTQPGIFAALFGQSSITIQASAVAQVQPSVTPCVLALSGQLHLQGNASINAPGCAIGTNSTAANSIDFGNTGSGSISVNVAAVTTAGGCSDSETYCGIGSNPPYPVTTYALPILNPLVLNLPKPLDTIIANAGLDALPRCANTPTDYGTTPCRNDDVTFNAGNYVLSGTYIFSGSVSIASNANITGTATLILLPGATLSVGANASVNLTAQNPVPTAQLPAAISSAANSSTVLDGLLLYDPESGTISSNGNPTLVLNGVVYAPNATYALNGNSGQTGACTELIAAAISFVGNPSYNASNCPPGVSLTAQAAQLVQ